MGNTNSVVKSLLRDESSALLQESLESHPTLKHFKVDAILGPGSGRMTRTYRLRQQVHHSEGGGGEGGGGGGGGGVEAIVALKAAIVEDTPDTERLIAAQQHELDRIRRALFLRSNDESCSYSSSSSSNLTRRSCSLHVAPFLSWFVGDPKPFRGGIKLRTIFLLRPHLYTTLSDRLASRPWLTPVEKLWIAHQLLTALDELHRANVCHGFLTTENVGLTSLNAVELIDLCSYKALTLPDDDPSDYLWYYQLQHDSHDATVKRSEKRCYIAPERFGTSSSSSSSSQKEDHPMSNSSLTPASDVFAAGCVLTELFLNGERCMDLGDVIEYRRDPNGELPLPIQQRLAKIESSHLRAACRHMLRLNPADRRSAREYWDRLHQADQFPPSFDTLTQLLIRVHNCPSPDARIAVLAAHYDKVLWETVGQTDPVAQSYFAAALGDAALEMLYPERPRRPSADQQAHFKAGPNPPRSLEGVESKFRDLLAETESLLRQLDMFDENQDLWFASFADSGQVLYGASDPVMRLTADSTQVEEKKSDERSPLCQSSLQIYLHIVLSTMQHVQRPATKLVALRLVERLANFSCDEARLQRIVPVTVSLLQDQDPLVRAAVLCTLTHTLSIVQTFAPSDSKIFPQYIFKRVAPMVSDPSLVVRVAFGKCLSILAETAHRFLDVSHAARMYEALGSSTGLATPEERSRKADTATTATVFADEVTRLLDTGDAPSPPRSGRAETSVSTESGVVPDPMVSMGRTLISSSYGVDLAAIHETISRWVVHIASDQSEYSSLPKRAMLFDLGRLCTFFGVEGVMSFILPQILAFLNDRKNGELRAALFDAMPSLCHIIGRAATEEYVLPCVEIGLVDVREAVICNALSCLSNLIEMKLLSKSVLLGETTNTPVPATPMFLTRYAALLLHPAREIRGEATKTFSSLFRSVASPKFDVCLMPYLLPVLRFQPSTDQIFTALGLQSCLKEPWSHSYYQAELDKFLTQSRSTSTSDSAWTSVGDSVSESVKGNPKDREAMPPSPGRAIDPPQQNDPLQAYLCVYLRMLARHTAQLVSVDKQNSISQKAALSSGIEGSVKLAQSIMFPRQDRSVQTEFIPKWYSDLREDGSGKHSVASEATAIQSISDLGHVFGLSIMGPTEGRVENIVGAACDPQESEAALQFDLGSLQARIIESAYLGHWGSETLVDPAIADTTLLVAKLKALGVPPLPPHLGQLSQTVLPSSSAKEISTSEWRPKTITLVASSSVVTGHTAPVVRMTVSSDSSFLVSGSHDGTCRIWEVNTMEDLVGTLESSAVYSGHCNERGTRVNDVATIESSCSVVSGASDGSVHVWRVDRVLPTSRSSGVDQSRRQEQPRVVGSAAVREMEAAEGEVLSVSNFNSLSASVVTFATQRGGIHSWDLRSNREPFCLKHSPEMGYLTCTALGIDRQWIVSGTSRGFVALWDVRFQEPVKLWRHCSQTSINRLATSVGTPPQMWTARPNPDLIRPFMFISAGINECAMFDVTTGTCCECFRTTQTDKVGKRSAAEECPPFLDEIPLRSRLSVGLKAASALVDANFINRPSCVHSTINCMVGSIGGHQQSYLVTAGSDRIIRFWDFTNPKKCFILSGIRANHARPLFERFDVNISTRLMFCSMPRTLSVRHVEVLPELHHHDSILDLKIVDKWGLVSCSRDSTIKLWR